ncbi:hypothetical protein BH10BAC1_BH10BAC1_11460 [soil metagenome]
MKCITIKLSTILFLGLGFTEIEAQEIANTSGGNALGSGGSVNYSVGQIVYTTNTGTNGSVAQGVQQPYEISIVTGFEDASKINLSFSVYPNPTTDYLKLNIENYKTQNLTFILLDIDGKLLESKKLENNETSISMKNNASGIYFLKIIESNKELKTFKIIKN